MIQVQKTSNHISRLYPFIILIAIGGLLATELKRVEPLHGDGKVCHHDAVVQTESMNVLYFGADNVIDISIPGQEVDKINAAVMPADAGQLVKIEDGKYQIQLLTAKHKSVKVSVSQSVDDGLVRSAGATEFKVLSLPAPVASIGGNSGPTISPEELGKAEEVQVDLMDFPIEGIDYKVIRYDYIYKPTRGNLIRGTEQGAAYPKALKDMFKSAARGDLLIISGITASYNGYTRQLHGSLVYTVR